MFGDVGELPAKRHETLAVAATLDDLVKQCMHNKELKVFVKELCEEHMEATRVMVKN